MDVFQAHYNVNPDPNDDELFPDLEDKPKKIYQYDENEDGRNFLREAYGDLEVRKEEELKKKEQEERKFRLKWEEDEKQRLKQVEEDKIRD